MRTNVNLTLCLHKLSITHKIRIFPNCPNFPIFPCKFFGFYLYFSEESRTFAYRKRDQVQRHSVPHQEGLFTLLANLAVAKVVSFFWWNPF